MRKTAKTLAAATLATGFVLGLSFGAQACPAHTAQTPVPNQEVADGSQTIIPTPEKGS